MRYPFILITFMALLSSCKQNCSQIHCSECKPFESSGTIIFEFDTTRFDSFIVYNEPSTTDTTYTTYPLNVQYFRMPFSQFGYYKRLGLKDKTRTWRIGETKFHKTAGEDCCDCGTETIVQITINDTTYSRSQLPLVIK